MRFGLVKTVLVTALGVTAVFLSAGTHEAAAQSADERAGASVRRTHRVQPRQVALHRHRASVRHVQRRPRPVRHAASGTARPAEAVYYYDNTLVGRDPDANIRLMLLRDNARTMWAR
jgi:hypothetical protein